MQLRTKTAKSDEFTRFEQALRHLMAVPKSEVDKEKAKYEKERDTKKKKLVK